ncbi:MAG: type II secretion system F family protein [Zoogloea sp.]|nr:type II secretion system F family protein [Zoogloea sp.]
MARYNYRALRQDGLPVRGTLEADSLDDLERQLAAMHLDLLQGRPAGLGFRSARRVPRRALINFCFHLEQLLRAGVPILEGLADLRDATRHAGFHTVLGGVVARIEGGATFSEALAADPLGFDRIFVGLAAAGEQSGTLPEMLGRLAATLKREDEFAAHTRKLMLYPAFVGSIILVAISVSLLVVVPELAKLFKSTGQTLPLSTRILIGASDFLRHYGWLLALAALLAVLWAGYRRATDNTWRARLDQFALQLPFIGQLRRKIVLARFASLFATLYAAGIPIVEALRTTAGAIGNAAIGASLARAGDAIMEGRSLSAAFAEEALFPPLLVRMLKIGETTGGLDTALANLAYFYERDVQEAIAGLQALMEPALTVVLGGVLLWVMAAVLGPIYDIISTLQP